MANDKSVNNPPYVRYERVRAEDPQDIGANLILGLRSKGVEVFLMGIHPDEVHGGGSVVQYYPNGRHAHGFTYQGPTAINFFLSKVLPGINAEAKTTPQTSR